jgi:hypothetical protein
MDLNIRGGTAIVCAASCITTDAGRRAVLTAAPQPDILINNAGCPPPGDFRANSLALEPGSRTVPIELGATNRPSRPAILRKARLPE